jgi:hypothetical protein
MTRKGERSLITPFRCALSRYNDVGTGPLPTTSRLNSGPAEVIAMIVWILDLKSRRLIIRATKQNFDPMCRVTIQDGRGPDTCVVCPQNSTLRRHDDFAAAASTVRCVG